MSSRTGSSVTVMARVMMPSTLNTVGFRVPSGCGIEVRRTTSSSPAPPASGIIISARSDQCSWGTVQGGRTNRVIRLACGRPRSGNVARARRIAMIACRPMRSRVG